MAICQGLGLTRGFTMAKFFRFVKRKLWGLDFSELSKSALMAAHQSGGAGQKKIH
jgi:hypothetical protein